MEYLSVTELQCALLNIEDWAETAISSLVCTESVLGIVSVTRIFEAIHQND